MHSPLPSRDCGLRRAFRCGVATLACVLGIVLAAASARADKPAGVTAQTVKLPSGPTSLKGLGESFEPNIATGTGSYSVGIELPPGFLQPSLTLGYSGGSGKSELGMGWQLPVLR